MKICDGGDGRSNHATFEWSMSGKGKEIDIKRILFLILNTSANSVLILIILIG